MLLFGCKRCSCPVMREIGGKLVCQACGAVFERDSETAEQRDARILFLSRLDGAEGLLELSPPRFEDAEEYFTRFIEYYPENSNGYWGLVRAKYGIKYERDNAHSAVASCYLSSYESFKEDRAYQKALRFAESDSIRAKYEAEADKIADACREFNECYAEAQKYNYDVFISFKASDENNSVTADTFEMQNLYTSLTEEGFKVFFSPMSMQRFVGKHYDAYILSALRKARVMIVYGSRPEYFTAPWVQNEWTRYKRMADRREDGKSPSSLLAVYKGFNPKELPRELRGVEALDRNGMRFYNILLDRIHELLTKTEDNTLRNQVNEQPFDNNSSHNYDNASDAARDSERIDAERSAQMEEENRRLREQLDALLKKQNEQEQKRKAEEEAKRQAEEERKRTTSEANASEAARLYQQYLKEKKIDILIKAAKLGNPDAQFELGWCYENGQGVTQNQSKAIEWYTKAAEQGYANAQNNLGVCYENGQGVTQSWQKAVEWYTKAANQSHALAQNNLGECYFYGNGVTKSYEDACKWYAKAAEQGHSGAQFSLGWCYENGQGVTQNWPKAIELYTKAANQGHASAQYNLGNCYANGEGVAQSWQKAIELYTKAANQGHASAQYNLGFCYANGNGVPQSYEKAFALYTEAANQGNLKALCALGNCYYNGKGISQNYAKAVELYAKAAYQGHINAQYNLALCYEYGNGISKNLYEAKKWYQKAADQGNEGAKDKLDKLKQQGF